MDQRYRLPIYGHKKFNTYNCLTSKVYHLGSYHFKLKYLMQNQNYLNITLSETLRNLADYERKGEEIISRYCNAEGNRPILSPPVPKQTYIDRYPDEVDEELRLRLASNVRRPCAHWQEELKDCARCLVFLLLLSRLPLPPGLPPE